MPKSPVPRQSVRVLGNAADAFELSQTQIALGGGRTVQLADVATVTDSFGEQSRIGKVRGKQVVNFSLSRAKGASDVTVYDEAVKILDQIEKDNPGVQFTQLFTSVDYTKAQYSSSMLAMVEGAVLAVLVVFLFLRDIARDGHFRPRNPTLGHPDLLVHGPDGLHAELAVASGAGSGGRRARR